jgi:alpha-ketoglutarate-dependent 2,4-dichlorophenoxyacetate dioxygenase
MQVIPVDATLGAVVHGVALNDLSDDQFEQIYAAWLDRAVLLFPKQKLTDDEQLEFTRRFGRLEMSFTRSQARVVGRLSNVDPDGTIAKPDSLRARFLRGNNEWHSDSSYKRVGAKASLLAAHVVPRNGGETEWADMRAAYDALDDAQRASLEQKVAVHGYRFSHTPFGGLEIAGDDIVYLPDVQHPVLRTHPETGRRVLFVGRHASHIIGADLEQSRTLLRRLTTSACQPPRLWKHSWEPGDLVIWDNRAVLHRGHPWSDAEPRTMVRTTVAGDDPDNEWAHRQTGDEAAAPSTAVLF